MSDFKGYPQPTAADNAHAMTRGLIGAIPLVGAPVAELFAIIATPLLEQRRTEWAIKIGERLEALEEAHTGILERLQRTELFVDASIKATRIALSTSEEEKKQALENALLNTANENRLDSTITTIFFNLIEQYTPLHLKILKYFYSPREWYDGNSRQRPHIENGTSIHYAVADAFPEVSGQYDLVNLIWSDLKQAGLQNSTELSSPSYGDSYLQPRLTELGRKFVDFIS